MSVVKCVCVSEWGSLWVRGVSVCVCRGQYSASCWAEVPPKTNFNCLSIFLTSSKLDYGNRTHSYTFTLAAVQWYYMRTTVWAESTSGVHKLDMSRPDPPLTLNLKVFDILHCYNLIKSFKSLISTFYVIVSLFTG